MPDDGQPFEEPTRSPSTPPDGLIIDDQVFLFDDAPPLRLARKPAPQPA